MDFDYQRIKDTEKQQRDDVLRTLPVPRRAAVQGRNASQPPPPTQIPPIKPRRSIKCRVKMQDMSDSQNLSLMNMSLSGALEPLSTSLRARTLLWFETSQLPRLRRPGRPLPSWLHGFLTRKEAEEFLQDRVQGCFLLRLSESMIGFVLSYRGKDRCRHFIIQEEGGGDGGGGGRYLITGEDSRHDSLQELVSYYTQNYVGPFEELLTVPFVKGNDGSNVVTSGDVKGWGVRSNTATGYDAEVTPLAPPAVPPTPRSTENPVPPSNGTDDYAVVKKVLKKSHSLLDVHPATNTNVLSSEVSDCIPVTSQHLLTAAEGAGAEGGMVDAPYARVNKAPRAARNTPAFYINIPPVGDAAPLLPPPPPPPSSSLSHESAEEQKYWEMVPLHTYEETHHLRRPVESDDRIDFYAVGGRQVALDSAEIPQNHLYSEVNLRGREVQDQVQIPGRTGPNLPLRPPPRTSNCPSRSGGNLQLLP
ncbi:SH2 domain-containing protein 7 isoform X2 [Brienomyrus brachyistius]|uniref:SH2 domain-containing protein 7 isoform X2 n=1 Tax=Brienomyrus brachyistius TaxID=42636 RepID=UPI0020B39248|nr:SH2 domain-containing protein 7 isoform X2 [Brienomyrus brachyistius]